MSNQKGGRINTVGRDAVLTHHARRWLTEAQYRATAKPPVGTGNKDRGFYDDMDTRNKENPDPRTGRDKRHLSVTKFQETVGMKEFDGASGRTNASGQATILFLRALFPRASDAYIIARCREGSPQSGQHAQRPQGPDAVMRLTHRRLNKEHLGDQSNNGTITSPTSTSDGDACYKWLTQYRPRATNGDLSYSHTSRNGNCDCPRGSRTQAVAAAAHRAHEMRSQADGYSRGIPERVLRQFYRLTRDDQIAVCAAAHGVVEAREKDQRESKEREMRRSGRMTEDRSGHYFTIGRQMVITDALCANVGVDSYEKWKEPEMWTRLYEGGPTPQTPPRPNQNSTAQELKNFFQWEGYVEAASIMRRQNIAWKASPDVVEAAAARYAATATADAAAAAEEKERIRIAEAAEEKERIRIAEAAEAAEAAAAGSQRDDSRRAARAAEAEAQVLSGRSQRASMRGRKREIYEESDEENAKGYGNSAFENPVNVLDEDLYRQWDTKGEAMIQSLMPDTPPAGAAEPPGAAAGRAALLAERSAGGTKKYRKHKSRKGKSRKVKSMKRKSRKRKSRKVKSRKGKNRK